MLCAPLLYVIFIYVLILYFLKNTDKNKINMFGVGIRV